MLYSILLKHYNSMSFSFIFVFLKLVICIRKRKITRHVMNGWMVHSLALYAILTSSPLGATTTDPTTTNKTAMTTRNSNENVGKTSTTQSKKEKKIT